MYIQLFFKQWNGTIMYDCYFPCCCVSTSDKTDQQGPANMKYKYQDSSEYFIHLLEHANLYYIPTPMAGLWKATLKAQLHISPVINLDSAPILFQQ